MRDFQAEGVDIRFGEKTPTKWFDNTMNTIEGRGAALKEALIARIRASNRVQFDAFLERLRVKLSRYVEKLVVVPLFGTEEMFDSLTDAIEFVSFHRPESGSGVFRGFEISVKYSNGDRMDATFTNLQDAENFLQYLAL